jgi:hypothetical protein
VEQPPFALRATAADMTLADLASDVDPAADPLPAGVAAALDAIRGALVLRWLARIEVTLRGRCR